MKTKITLGSCALLVALIIGSTIIVPAVGAEIVTGTVIDFDQYRVPELKMNNITEEIAISRPLSLQTERENSDQDTYGVFYGSIIVHSADGKTKVYDRNGNQKLLISDGKSEKVPTPAGVEKSCTRVHQIPNDSRIYNYGNKIFVLNSEGEIILLIINENATSDQKKATRTEWPSHDWVESAENTVNDITENVAYWNVPTNPPSLESNEMIYLFNSITGNSGSKRYILQPVLRYYGSTQRWEGQAWACDVYGNDDFIGPLFNTATGHTMKGRIYWSSDLQLWSITLYDQTTGQYSSISTNCIVPQSNSRVAHVLEGWYIDDNSDVPGDTLFYDMSYKSYGASLSVSLERWYSTNVPDEIMRYCQVEIIQNPSRVRLNTYN